MMSPACIVVLCFALATLTFGAPNGDFANFDIAPLKQGLEAPGHKDASPVLDSGAQSKVPQRPVNKDAQPPASKDPQESIPKIVVYEFGTQSKYDVQISPDIPCTAPPSSQPMKYTATAKYKDHEGRNITYVRIAVFQTGEGSAKILEGAIGTSVVNVAIVADASFVYRHDAKFYTSSLIQKTYSIGNRTNQLVELSRVQGAEQYSKDCTSSVILKSPKSYENITAVLITTKQTSDLGQAYISKGSLGENQIEISLRVENTKMLSYEAVFYTSKVPKPCVENNNPSSSNQTDHHNKFEFIYLKAS